MASFDARMSSSSFPPLPPHAPYSSHHHIPSQQSPASRSFGPINGLPKGSNTNPTPQIYTAVYSGVAVYEMEINGVAVMRRRSDSWLNATQILKVAGVDKGRRTKILEKEVQTGTYDKVQGGYGRYQGTWIDYNRAREFCRQYGVEELLRPVLEYDLASDGTSGTSKLDTPTKEQAMAANRKRFYNTSIDQRQPGSLPTGTFFQNISPTASNALAAMNKAARLESPMPRPNSAVQQKRPQTLLRHSSSQQQLVDSGVPGSQSSMHSATQEHTVNGDAQDFFRNSIGSFADTSMLDVNEPPRKRIRASSNHEANVFDSSLHEETPTEPNDSFYQPQLNEFDAEQGPLPPMFAASDRLSEEKRIALLDLFADPSRADLASHPAVESLGRKDLDIPLDNSANTALHWAATLARVELMRTLIAKGANPLQGNAVGQTPLMAAVQVNNSLDRGCFPEMLEILGTLIDVRDNSGRTVLHHIAVSSGIKGRGRSSRYYLESLLEFIVRQGSASGSNSQQVQSLSQSSFTSNAQSRNKPITLTRFMAEVVNAQDKSGNTALNLVSRIGNHPIINQLEEVGADFEIANHMGFKPADFGVYPRSKEHPAGSQQKAGEGGFTGASPAPDGSQQQPGDSQNSSTPTEVERIKEEIFTTTQSILAQTQASYTAALGTLHHRLESQNTALRTVAAEFTAESSRLDALLQRQREHSERAQRIMNLQRALTELSESDRNEMDTEDDALSSELDLSNIISADADDTNVDTSQLPSAAVLRARLHAYNTQNDLLQQRLSGLQSRSSDLERQYRRVVALCTGVRDEDVEGLLEGLVQAVESEGVPGNGADESLAFSRLGLPQGDAGVGDVSRVREFLRKFEGVGAGPDVGIQA